MRDKKSQELKSQNVREVTFMILRLPLTRIIIGCAICAIVPLAINSFLKLILKSSSLEEDAARMIRASLFLVITLFTYYFLFRFYETRKIEELSLRHLPKEGLLGMVGALLSISLVIFTFYLMGYYKVLLINKSIFNVAYLLIIITSLAAFEEVLFRGIGYRIIEEKLGTNLALIISGLLFGLVHILNTNATIMSIIGAGIGGALAGIMFSMTRRLWLPIFFHTGWNFAQVFYGITVSGIKGFLINAFYQSSLHGPDVLTGGAFGPENSIITIALTLILFIILYRWTCENHRLIKLYWI